MAASATISAPEKTAAPAASLEAAAKATDAAPEMEQVQQYCIQPKLTVGAPDDPYEKEADAVEDKVMRMPEQSFVQHKCAQCEREENIQRKPEEAENVQLKRNAATNFIQRKCAACEGEEKEKIHRKPLSESITPFIQTKTENSVPVNPAVSQSIESSKGTGTSLNRDTHSFMSSRFGNDFSNVKVHTDNEAVQLSRELNAKAFTVGNDVYFNEGQYQPYSDSGKQLLAHELTHVIQQQPRSAPLVQRKKGKVKAAAPQQPDATASHAISMPWKKSAQNTIYQFIRAYGILGPQKLSDAQVYSYVESFLTDMSSLKDFNINYEESGETKYRENLDMAEADLLANRYAMTTFVLSDFYSDRLLAALGYTWESFKAAGAKPTDKDGASMNDIMDMLDAVGSGPDFTTPPGKREIIMDSAPMDQKALVERFLKDMEPLVADYTGKDPLPPYVVTGIDIDKIRELYLPGNEAQLKRFIAFITQSKDKKSGKFMSPDMTLGELIETVEAMQQIRHDNAEYGMKEGAGHNDEKLVANRPVHGKIISMNSPAVEWQELHFAFQVYDKVDAWKVPMVHIHWHAFNKKKKAVDAEYTHYIDVRDDSIINDKIFEVKPLAAGEYIIHAQVDHNFYYPAVFSEPITVVKPGEALNALRADSNKTEQLADVGAFSAYNYSMGIINDISSNDEGDRAYGNMTPGASFGIARQITILEKEIADLESLEKHYGGEGHYKEWVDAKIKRLRDTIGTLSNDKKDPNNKEIQVQGFYVSRTPGVGSGALKLAAWYTHSNKEAGMAKHFYFGNLFDRSDIVDAENLHFEEMGFTYEAMLEALFVELSSEYPVGNIEATFQLYDNSDAPTTRTVTYRRVTDTVWKDIKAVAYSLPVQIITNIIAGILTIFPPTTALGITLGVLYNGAQVVADIASKINTGRSITASDILNVVLVIADVIPFLGPAASEAGVGLRLVRLSSKVGGVAGNLYLITDNIISSIDKMRDGLVSQLAEVYKRVTILQEQHAPADILQQDLDQMRSLESDINAAGIKIASEMLATQATIMGITHLATAKFKEHLDGMTSQERAAVGITDADMQTLSHQPEGRMVTDLIPGRSSTDGLAPHPTLAEHTSIVPGIDGIFSNGQKNREMKVRYEIAANGVIEKIFIEAGLDADLTLLKQHLPTIQLLQQYQHFSGKVKVLLKRLYNLYMSFTGSRADMIPLPGSRAFEAKLEIEKLPTIIESKAALLSGLPLDDIRGRSELKADIAFLESEVDRHNRTLDMMDMELGEGFVAATVPKNEAAEALGYPPAPPGHYYYETQNGGYQLHRYSNSDVRPQHIVTKDGKPVLEHSSIGADEMRTLEPEAKPDRSAAGTPDKNTGPAEEQKGKQDDAQKPDSPGAGATVKPAPGAVDLPAETTDPAATTPAPAPKTEAELRADLDPALKTGETAADTARRVEAARIELEHRRIFGTYEALGEAPDRFDIATNDAMHPDAHTLGSGANPGRHGPEIPLERSVDSTGAPDGTRTIEGRVYGDPPWTERANFSGKWRSIGIIDRVLNRYLRANWENVRSDLATDGAHTGVFPAEEVVGDGYFNKNYGTANPPQAVGPVPTNMVRVTILLVPGTPPTYYVITCFPTISGM